MILIVGAEPPLPLDPQDTEGQVHHRDLSSVLFYSVLHDHGCVASSSKKPCEKVTLHTVLLCETVMSNLTVSLIFVR